MQPNGTKNCPNFSMPTMSTPEAEPKDRKKPAEKDDATGQKENKKGKEKDKEKEKKDGDDGASTPTVTPEMRKKIIDEYLKEQEAENNEENGNDDEPEVSAALWRTSREAVREPLGKVFKYGAIAAAPIPAAAIWGLDKIARNTISRIPVVGNIYEIPRSIITSTATQVRDLLAGAITLPALPLDVAGNVIQGLSGKTKSEEKGIIGRTLELIPEKIGKSGHWVLDKAKYLGGKGVEATKWSFDTLVHAIAGAFSIPYHITRGALGGVMKTGKTAIAVGPLSAIASVATVGILTYVGAYAFGATDMWWMAAEKIWALVKSIPSLLGA